MSFNLQILNVIDQNLFICFQGAYILMGAGTYTGNNMVIKLYAVLIVRSVNMRNLRQGPGRGNIVGG